MELRRNREDLILRPSGVSSSIGSLVCWTRMQTEAGQPLDAIVRRKELERSAGSGIFFWGVGNAPNRQIRHLALTEKRVDVVFSIMKSKPKAVDRRPSGVLVWNSYFDKGGVLRAIPNHVIVTSRANTEDTASRAHYALICQATAPLSVAQHGNFNPRNYRNVGERQGQVGSSQVTALLEKVSEGEHSSDYQINMVAQLVGSYWVKLAEPALLGIEEHDRIMLPLSDQTDLSTVSWISLAARIRAAGHRLCSERNIFELR